MIGCVIMYCDIGVFVFFKSMYYFILYEIVYMIEMFYCVEDILDCFVVELICKVRLFILMMM